MNSSLEIYLIKPVYMFQDDVISLTFGKSLVNKMRKNDPQKNGMFSCIFITKFHKVKKDNHLNS